ncbi:hypothetical protein [Actinophytocola sp.]|uniref:hypothetical protein n=1 Tax=Actinophytocola sp. TaxID=1872138 RepID=UPI002D7E75F9|nr:hypothetical protein [Actinophytocola sp.]HET9140405.1 hypothetical protein [Actinophytocola sp.]
MPGLDDNDAPAGPADSERDYYAAADDFGATRSHAHQVLQQVEAEDRSERPGRYHAALTQLIADLNQNPR